MFGLEKLAEKKPLRIIDSRDQMYFGGPATIMRENLTKVSPEILESYNLVDSRNEKNNSFMNKKACESTIKQAFIIGFEKIVL